MRIASRIGTPALMSVPSVRVNLAIAVFLSIVPSTGIRSTTMSVTALPGFVFRISLKKAKSRIGEHRIQTTPGTAWSGVDVPATHFDELIMKIVTSIEGRIQLVVEPARSFTNNPEKVLAMCNAVEDRAKRAVTASGGDALVAGLTLGLKAFRSDVLKIDNNVCRHENKAIAAFMIHMARRKLNI